jgi:hypothetical protein
MRHLRDEGFAGRSGVRREHQKHHATGRNAHRFSPSMRHRQNIRLTLDDKCDPAYRAFERELFI